MKIPDKFKKRKSPDAIDLQKLEEDGASKRTLTGAWVKIIFVVALAMSFFHIYALILSSVTMWYLYCVHVGTGAILTFALYRGGKRSPMHRPAVIDITMMVLTAYAFGYMIVVMNELVYRIGIDPTAMDLIVAVIIIVVVLEITRRTCGNILPVIALLFILYAKFGHLIPGTFGHRPYTWSKILSYQLGLDALFSTSVQASATYVFLFLLFGAFLQESGCSRFFIDFATSAAGGSRGGPAKVAVISSALFGTVSGNSVANVVTTGSFTIPLMKSIGYKPKFAGAVEATASTGGQIMPPILGSAAFIMAALIGVPYKSIIVASILPAAMYFYTVFMMVDLEAAKTGLHGLSRAELPQLKSVMKNIYLLLPLVVIIVILTVFNLSPIRAAAWGMVAAIAVTYLKRDTRMGFKGHHQRTCCRRKDFMRPCCRYRNGRPGGGRVEHDRSGIEDRRGNRFIFPRASLACADPYDDLLRDHGDGPTHHGFLSDLRFRGRTSVNPDGGQHACGAHVRILFRLHFRHYAACSPRSLRRRQHRRRKAAGGGLYSM